MKSKYALVTGTTSGIGYEIAKLLATDGYNLIIVSRNQDELTKKEKEFKQYGVDVITVVKNLFQTGDVYSLYADLRLNGISPYVLVNDAGQGVYGKFQDTDIHREKGDFVVEPGTFKLMIGSDYQNLRTAEVELL